MFVDSVSFVVSSGNGGAGCASFRREKHIVLGGPDGGDGGDGGSVFFVVDNNTHTLGHFKGKKKLSAKNGANGMPKNMTGKRGEDLEIIVPCGTCVYDDESGEMLFDLTREGQRELFLRGGKGGLGNVHFKTSVNQAPQKAQPGLKGESRAIRLELKLIADVGLVGFPNVGKSTLISVISNARPQIANYEFTTLTPKLGVVSVDEFSSFVMADIPGIIGGASVGKGLGLKFLKHIERTNFLLFVLDFSRQESLKMQFETLKNELENFSKKLALRNFGIAISKCDLANFDDDFGEKLRGDFAELAEFLQTLNNPQNFIIKISSIDKIGLNELKFSLLERVKIERSSAKNG